MSGRLLIADEMSINRIILKSRLKEAGYAALTVTSADTALEAALKEPPDMFILSETLGCAACFELARNIRAIPDLARIPTLLLTEEQNTATTLDAIEVGFDAHLPLLPDIGLLTAWIRSLLRRQAASAELGRVEISSQYYGFGELPQAGYAKPGQIALVADSLAEGLKWRNGLTQAMRDRIAVLDPRHSLAELDTEPTPDAIVLFMEKGAADATVQLISNLRCRLETLRAAIVVVQSEPDTDGEIAVLDAGACAVLRRGFETQELSRLLRKELARKALDDNRRAALQNGLRLASTDPLTGLLNRRSALTRLASIADTAASEGTQYAVMVLDLDRFKRVNDTYGHAAGDLVLREAAARMQRSLRTGDYMARIGGEEFLAVIQNCDLAKAETAAERLRVSVGGHPFQLDGTEHPGLSITISIGLVIAGRNGQAGSSAELIDLADRSLYAAKGAGRDQVSVHVAADAPASAWAAGV